MHHYHNRAMDTMVKGWTRIDMLIALYDRTIATVRFAQSAYESGNMNLVANKLLEVNRLMLGLHSGLDTENSEIAQNVGRLLNFVTLRINERNFDEAIRFLDELHASFSTIRDEAAALERSGEIPPLVDTSALNAFA